MSGMHAIQVIPDRFTQAELQALKDSAGTGSSQSEPFIRRPTRGIELKEDTFATLRVVSGRTGENLLMVDAGSRRKGANNQFLEIDGKRATDIYSNFLLQQVQDDRMEKQQILETFGEAFIFLYGERPRIMMFSGVLANTQDFNWEAEWWHNYENYLRGTRCVENDARVFLSFDNTLISGYIIGASSTKSAQERNYVNFQFQMFVTSYTNFPEPGNPHAQPGLGVVENIDLKDLGVDTSVFRPQLLPEFGRIPTTNTGFPVTGNGQVRMPSLEQGLMDQLSVITNAWQSTRDVVNNTISSISGIINGDHVRVPVGFAGAMAFDEDNNIKITSVRGGSPLTYSTFDKNDDEYVGVGDHYGSSRVRSGFLRNLGYTDIAQEVGYGQSLVREATKTWNKPPFNVTIPEEQMGPLSSFLVGRGVGLAGVVATRAVTIASGGINAAGSAATRFANALPNPVSVISE